MGARQEPGIVGAVIARNIVGACALLALLGIAVYLLFQIPWEYAIGGIAVLGVLLAIVGRDAPNAL
jgi:hypothetical protein